MIISKNSKNLINGIEALYADFNKTLNKNLCELIEENLNRHSCDELKIDLGNPVLLCYRKNRARCIGSFDFNNALFLEYNREYQEIWVLDENGEKIDLLANIPSEDAMSIFNIVVRIIKEY